MPERFPQFNEGSSETEKLSVERKNAFLKKLLSREVKPSEQVLYRELAARQRRVFSEWGHSAFTGGAQFAPFSKTWKQRLLNKESKPAFLQRLSESIKNETLIDLGGNEPFLTGEITTMPSVAREIGASKYISVDNSLMAKTSAVNKVVEYDFDYYQKTDTPETEVLAVKADMLEFVSRISNNSANFVLNGIDCDVIPEEKYRDELVKHIVRATKIGGLIWGRSSFVGEYLAGQPNFERIRTQPDKEDDGEELCFRRTA